MMSAAEVIKNALKEKGMSYSFISEKTGIKIDAISRSLLGKRRLPADEMIAICKAAQIDASLLYNNKTSVPPASGE